MMTTGTEPSSYRGEGDESGGIRSRRGASSSRGGKRDGKPGSRGRGGREHLGTASTGGADTGLMEETQETRSHGLEEALAKASALIETISLKKKALGVSVACHAC